MTFTKMNALLKAAALYITMPVLNVWGYITDAPYFYRDDRPSIVAHRGTYGFYPEHAVAGYVEAYYAGADFIEFDV